MLSKLSESSEITNKLFEVNIAIEGTIFVIAESHQQAKEVVSDDFDTIMEKSEIDVWSREIKKPKDVPIGVAGYECYGNDHITIEQFFAETLAEREAKTIEEYLDKNQYKFGFWSSFKNN